MKEISLNENDINKLRKKVKGKSVFTYIFLFASIFSIYYFFRLSATNYFILIFPTIVLFGTFYHLIYLNGTIKKDLSYNLKIIGSAKIIDKKIVLPNGFIKGDVNNTNHISNHYITIDDSVINKYKVSSDVFVRINVGDIVKYEYTKFGHFILNIECNSINIENNSNFK